MIRYEEGIAKNKIIFNSDLGNLSKELVKSNDNSLNFKICIVNQK